MLQNVREVNNMKKSYEMDMCNGPILSKVLVYAFPLMLSGILQLLFNAAGQHRRLVQQSVQRWRS